jgi:hypothetical protein
LFTSTDADLLPTNDHFYGDPYILPKPDNIFRASSNNFNHVSINSIDAQIVFMCEDQKTLEVDLQGIIEHTCDMTKYYVRQAFDTATRKVCHPV